MNIDPIYAPMDPALKPTRRMLMHLIGQESGGLLTRRAERLQIRGMSRCWPARSIEQLLGRLLDRAKAIEDCFGNHQAERRTRARNGHNLARVNGCDQPVISARASYPKTPAARERGCSVAAVGRVAGDTSPRETVRQPREVIV